MLESLTLDTFNPHLGDTFLIRLPPDHVIALALTEVRSLSEGTSPLPRPDGSVRRTPFSLVFTGPPKIVLPQSIYRLEHEKLGPCAIFIVPIGPGPQGMQYEAVFT